MYSRLRLLAALSCALACASCAASGRQPPNVLVVVIDTRRADRLGVYGNERGLTPFLDALAVRGTLFEHAYAVSSWTIPSVASFFTSRYPTQHHVVTFFSRIGESEVTLAERLHGGGWTGGCFSANPNLRTDWGYGQGFDELWSDQTPDVDVHGDTIRTQALAWLDRTWNRRSNLPAFLYLQYMEPHTPYDPPEPFRSRFAVDEAGKPFDMDSAVREAIARALPGTAQQGSDKPLDVAEAVRTILGRGTPLTKREILPFERLYDAEVATADDQVRQLFAELEKRGFLDNALVVVIADHGEEFVEHGRTSHGRTLYEESVHVPFIVVGPGVAAGRRVAENVSLIDLAPTLLDVLGLPAEPRFEGRSLVALLQPGSTADRGAGAGPDVLMQLERSVPVELDNRIHSRGFVRGADKLLLGIDGGTERYDLATDPAETAQLQASGAAQSAALSEALTLTEAHLGERAAAEAAQAPVDEKLKERLRALGYQP
jgi:arylsulfatase A-like enzyme